MALVDTISIRATADTAQASAGIARLGAALDKTAQSTEACTQSTKRNTTATKSNTAETSKNTREHKKASSAVKHHASGLKRLAAALKRIVIYRALRGLIKSITQAFAEGTKRMYEWSKANDQVFMRVMDTYATEVQYLKDALGAATAPLLEALLPTVVQLIDNFVELINIVNQFFRALNGYTDWVKVDKVAKQFQEDTESAAKAQKALNNQLMDFDQLNLITTPKSSGKEDETSSLSGHYTPIDPAIIEAASKFKQFLEPFKELKRILGEIWGQLKPIIAEFAGGVFSIFAQAVQTVAEVLKNLKDNGVFDVLLNIIRGISQSTLNLLQSVLDLFSKIVTDLSKSASFKKLIEAIGRFTQSGIDQTVKVINTLVQSGALDDIILGLEGFFDGLSILLDATDDVAVFLTDILTFFLPSIGKLAGIVLSGIGSILTSVGYVLSGIVELLSWIMGSVSNVSFWSGAWKIIYGAFLEPLLTMLDGFVRFGEIVAGLTGEMDEQSRKFFDDWKRDFGTFKGEVASGEIFLDDEAKKAAASVQSSADKATSAFKNSAKDIKADMGDAFGGMKTAIDDLVRSYRTSLPKIETEVTKVMDRMEEMARSWARNGKYWGSEWRKGIVEELKKLNSVNITMQPGQQGSWNNSKITVQAYAAGGFPDMGSMFVAGESGAEMVGTINGRTGVVSGDEISGIASAVYGTGAEEAALLRAILGAVQNKQLVISPSASLGKVVNQSNRLYAGVTG